MYNYIKILLKIIVIFFTFYFILNLVEHIFNLELDSYIIVVIFIVVASSTGIFNKKVNKW